MSHRVFLLSPASCAGKRCRLLLGRSAGFELALRMRREGAPLGEVFSFLSALYFRGKLSYARRFATPPAGSPGVLVITPNRGLVVPETAITIGDLRAFARAPIDAANLRYARPLRDDAQGLRARLPEDAEIVLLGSIATPKYVDVLLAAFGQALRFPGDFVGRGDMSRGGLLLRAARSGVELDYRPIDGSARRGRRAARLPPDPPSLGTGERMNGLARRFLPLGGIHPTRAHWQIVGRILYLAEGQTLFAVDVSDLGLIWQAEIPTPPPRFYTVPRRSRASGRNLWVSVGRVLHLVDTEEGVRRAVIRNRSGTGVL